MSAPVKNSAQRQLANELNNRRLVVILAAVIGGWEIKHTRAHTPPDGGRVRAWLVRHSVHSRLAARHGDVIIKYARACGRVHARILYKKARAARQPAPVERRNIPVQDRRRSTDRRCMRLGDSCPGVDSRAQHHSNTEVDVSKL